MEKMEASTEEIIVRQVSALVAALAELFHDDPKQQLETEAHLYRTLAINCHDKARMTEGLIRLMAAEDQESGSAVQ